MTLTISADHKNVNTTVECVDLTNSSLPTDPVAEQMIAEGDRIVERVKERLISTVPLRGIGSKEKRTEFATWLLSKVRDANGVDAVLVCGFYFKGYLRLPFSVCLFFVLRKEVVWCMCMCTQEKQRKDEARENELTLNTCF